MADMSICGRYDCDECPGNYDCGGCKACDGHPLGGNCIAAEEIKAHGMESYNKMEAEVVKEINGLGIENLHVDKLNLLNGFYVNIEYVLPNEYHAQFLKDIDIYWGSQIEIPGKNRCLGVAANRDFIIVSEYGENGADPELLLFKKR